MSRPMIDGGVLVVNVSCSDGFTSRIYANSAQYGESGSRNGSVAAEIQPVASSRGLIGSRCQANRLKFCTLSGRLNKYPWW